MLTVTKQRLKTMWVGFRSGPQPAAVSLVSFPVDP